MIGFAMTGSFCTHARAIEVLRALIEQGEDVLPIVSDRVRTTDTRFGKADDLLRTLTSLTGKRPILTIEAAEPLGPKTPLEALILCPCTGNTAAKIALGITDTPVTMAAKAHLRADRPLIIALASNDAIGGNFKNIAALIEKKQVFFVPLSQDDPKGKPHSLVAHFDLTLPTLALAREGKQIQPIFRCPAE